MTVINNISDWSGKVFCFCALIVVCVITYEVVARYAFNAPTLWAQETMTYTCGIFYMMGGAYTLYTRGHVTVDVLYARFSPRAKAITDSITFILTFLFLAVLIWTGGDFALSSFLSNETSGSAWSPPLWPLKFSIPVGAFLLLLQSVNKLIRDINIAFEKKEKQIPLRSEE